MSGATDAATDAPTTKIQRSSFVSTPLPPPAVRARKRRIGDYVITSELGHGGMASVYLAERRAEGTADTQTVALKVLDASAVTREPELLARFQREARVLRSLACPGIPRFVEAGRTEDGYYCALEYVPGRSLDRVLRDGGRLEPARVERLLSELSLALVATHEAGLVHRDVKPGNVIVTPEGRAWLIDFGLAKEERDFTLTRSDEFLGTPSYLAPEIADGKPADARSDAFALGMTGFQAALGSNPIKGTPHKILLSLARGEVPSPAQLLAGACPQLIAVLSALLTVSPTDRLSLRDVPGLLQGCCGEGGTPPVLRGLAA